MEKQKASTIENAGNWIKSSVTLKLLSVVIIGLLLLIPASMVKNLIEERQLIRNQAIDEVSTKWANEQTVYGPILTIPFVKESEDKGKISRQVHKAFFLPEYLDISGNVNSKYASPQSYH